jgi:hypothetical protein
MLSFLQYTRMVSLFQCTRTLSSLQPTRIGLTAGRGGSRVRLGLQRQGTYRRDLVVELERRPSTPAGAITALSDPRIWM